MTFAPTAGKGFFAGIREKIEHVKDVVHHEIQSFQDYDPGIPAQVAANLSSAPAPVPEQPLQSSQVTSFQQAALPPIVPVTQVSQQYYNPFTNSYFYEPEEGHWYNLDSGRAVKNMPKYEGAILNNTIRVAGTREMIDQFFQANNINPDELQERARNIQPYQIVTKSMKEKTDVCPLDVWTISQQLLDTIEPFGLDGLCTKIKIKRWLDGDTLEVAYFEPTDWLAEEHEKREGIFSYCIAGEAQVGCVKVVKMRLSGIDAAEHDTEQGQCARMLMKKRALQFNNNCYAIFRAWEKFGRAFGEIYTDIEFTDSNCLNYYLLDFEHPRLGKLVERYSGDQKSAYMKSLPKIDPYTQENWEQKYWDSNGC